MGNVIPFPTKNRITIINRLAYRVDCAYILGKITKPQWEAAVKAISTNKPIDPKVMAVI